MTTDQQLKACPFCSGEASLCKSSISSVFVKCDCGIETIYFGFSGKDDPEELYKSYLEAKNKAIEAWNRRVT